MLTKTTITTQLNTTCSELADTVRGVSADRFYHEPETEWSAAGYLEHLILSVKGVVKGLNVPPLALQGLFGRSKAPSRTYEALVAFYDDALAAGGKAPANMSPVAYRMPDEVSDLRAYLVGEWESSNHRLVTALDKWSEDKLDSYRLPHPLLGKITVREMLYFTLYHNQCHLGDIQRLTGGG